MKIVYVLAFFAFVACSDSEGGKSGVKFTKIQIGMSRGEAEKILGKPLGETNGSDVFYIRPGPDKKYESTYSHAQIKITYSSTNTVMEKEYIGKGK